MKWDLYNRTLWWKISLILFGTLIGLGSLLYTESFLRELRAEEERKIKLWAEAVEAVFYASDDTNLSFYTNIIQDNKTIPVILTDSADHIIAFRNIQVPEHNKTQILERKLLEFKQEGQVLENAFADGNVNYLYYKGSTLLTKLRFYPLILLAVIGVYMLISYMAFSNARRSEQNKVWTGMARETAHQIGTPLSALLGWTAYLKTKYPQESAFMDMEQDLDRLTAISDRFSKIGSQPKLTDTDLKHTLEKTLNYLQPRLPKRILLERSLPTLAPVSHNAQLIGWVVENLLRNAVDAIEGSGTIKLELHQQEFTTITIIDNGKGIPQKIQRRIFKPGFTSKSRGWGLGLSLSKRIVEEYHNGKLQLVKSQPGEGSQFTIELPTQA